MDSSVLWQQKYVNEDGEISDEDVENVLLEIIRLFPPFFGCFRVATEDFELEDVHVEKGKKFVILGGTTVYFSGPELIFAKFWEFLQK